MINSEDGSCLHCKETGMGNLPRVAYFCMEFGLHENFPYAGAWVCWLATIEGSKGFAVTVIGLGILWNRH